MNPDEALRVGRTQLDSRIYYSEVGARPGQNMQGIHQGHLVSAYY